MNELHDIVIEENKKQTKYLLAGDLFMIVSSVIVAWLGFNDGGFLFRVVGIAGILYFTAALFAIAGRLLRSRPLLVIKEEGIVDTSSVSSIGFISYLDIDHFEIVNIMGQKGIGVIMCDNDEFLNKLPVSKKNAIKGNLKLGYPPVIIRVNTAQDMEIEDIYTLLRKRNDDFSILYR